jgi:hypothetical protein
MRNRAKLSVAIVATIPGVLLSLAACGGSDPGTGPGNGSDPDVVTVTVSPNLLTVLVGGTQQLTARDQAGHAVLGGVAGCAEPSLVEPGAVPDARREAQAALGSYQLVFLKETPTGLAPAADAEPVGTYLVLKSEVRGCLREPRPNRHGDLRVLLAQRRSRAEGEL